MRIQATDIGQRYNRQWIFKNLNYTIESGACIAIVGTNGSGKTTLLKILSGYQTATRGKVTYSVAGQKIHEEHLISRTSYVAPYLNLVEELTLSEHLDFHFTYKTPTIPKEEILIRSGLIGAKHKMIGEFSSGMKQRLKLALGLFSEGDLLLLDEPTSNLDEDGFNWYKQELVDLLGKKTILIASNQPTEYEVSKILIEITRFKG